MGKGNHKLTNKITPNAYTKTEKDIKKHKSIKISLKNNTVPLTDFFSIFTVGVAFKFD